jgi:hypothetical protein
MASHMATNARPTPANKMKGAFLIFTDHLIGKPVYVSLCIDGKMLTPAEMRAQIMRPLQLLKAATWFFARRSPSDRHRPQEPLPPLGCILAEYYPSVPARVMIGCTFAACQRIAVPPAEMLVSDRTTRRWTEWVMDRVTRGRKESTGATALTLIFA